MLDQEALGLPLRQDEDERIRRVEVVEVEADVGDPAAVVVAAQAVHPLAAGEHLVADSHVVEDLQGPRAGSARARDWSVGPSFSSMIRQATPCRRSSQAIVSPTGPAPTTRTSISSTTILPDHPIGGA